MKTYFTKDFELFFEPRNNCLADYNWPEGEPEMSAFESSFLCGLIKQKKPHKIVEVGVAGGGTTAIILKCIEMLGLTDTDIYSVDISEKFYRGNGERTGFLADEIINNADVPFKHLFLLGKLLPEYLNTIGGNIDFVILDTRHSLPGELLDFLAIFPYLKDRACIVLHDIALQHYGGKSFQFATQVLFGSVIADKILVKDNDRIELYPNIGAFVINEHTDKSIRNVLDSMLLTWHYDLSEKDKVTYYNHYRKHYGEDFAEVFEIICKMQKETFLCNQHKQKCDQSLIVNWTYRINRIIRRLLK